jgi:hypothetical protein
MCITNFPNDFIIYPSISPEEGEPNNEVIPSKEFKYQLKSQILSEIKMKGKYVIHTGAQFHKCYYKKLLLLTLLFNSIYHEAICFIFFMYKLFH